MPDELGGPRKPRIAYYVHHHGTGHQRRFAEIRRHDTAHWVPMSQRRLDGGVLLPTDVPDGDIDDPTAGGVLHWAPIDPRPGPARLSALVEGLAAAKVDGLVADVSVEVALTARLAGLPTCVVRQHGRRDDTAHQLAFRSARRLIAPFPSVLEHPTTPAWVRDSTTYAGFIGRAGPLEVLESTPTDSDVVVVWGSGGGSMPVDVQRRLCDAVAPSTVWLLGEHHAEVVDGIERRGWVADVRPYLVRRPVVVASAGNNAVADAAIARCPLVVLPQDRPFDEQRLHAESLERCGLAAVMDDVGRATEWTDLLALARERSAALAAVADHDGARRAAEAIADALGTDTQEPPEARVDDGEISGASPSDPGSDDPG